MLGLAIAGPGDRVSARKSDAAGVNISAVLGVDGEEHPILSANGDENTASIAAHSLWENHGDGSGLELIVRKGIPLQSGMGSSAASAVAAVVAANALLDSPLGADELLQHALAGEKYASGGLHADNVAPSLIGGMVLCPQVLLPRMVRLPVPDGLSSVLIHPALQVNTAESRKGLADSYPLSQWLAQQGYLAGFVAACASGDVGLFGECLCDVVIEPQRASSVPCFDAVKAAALESGALGCSLSGSGPSIFAICPDAAAQNLAIAMELACRETGVECESWISPLNAPGAHVESDQ